MHTILSNAGAGVIAATFLFAGCNAMQGRNDGTGAIAGAAVGGLGAGLGAGLATGNPAIGLAAGIGGAALGAWAGDQIQGRTRQPAPVSTTTHETRTVSPDGRVTTTTTTTTTSGTGAGR